MKMLAIEKNKVEKLSLPQPLTASLALVTGANFTITPALPTATLPSLNLTGTVVWGTGPEQPQIRSLVNHLLELAAWVEQTPGLNLNFKDAARPKKLNDNDSASASRFESHQQYRSRQTRHLRYCLDEQALVVLNPPRPRSLPLPLSQITTGYTLRVVELGKVLAELDGCATWVSHNVWRWQREERPTAKTEEAARQRQISELDSPYSQLNLNLTLSLLEMLTTQLRQGLHSMVNAFVFMDLPLADHITTGQAVIEGIVRRLKQELLTQSVTASTPGQDQALILLLQTVYYLQYIGEQIMWCCRQENAVY